MRLLPLLRQTITCYSIPNKISPILHLQCLKVLTNTSNQNFRPFSMTIVLQKGKNTGGGESSSSGGKPKRLLTDNDLLKSGIDWSNLKIQFDKLVQELYEQYKKQITLRTSSLAFEELQITLDGKQHLLKELTQIIQKSPQLFMVDLTRYAQYIPKIIESIHHSGLNINPQQDGTTIYLPVPKVTRQHREELAKNAKKLSDQTIIRMREIYSKTHRNLNKKSDVKMSKDLLLDLDENLKYRLDSYIQQVEKIKNEKQNELLNSTF